MVELIVPSDFAERLSADIGQNIIYEKVFINQDERLHKYRYTFVFTVDKIRRLVQVEIDTVVDFGDGPNVFPILYDRLLRKMKQGEYI